MNTLEQIRHKVVNLEWQVETFAKLMSEQVNDLAGALCALRQLVEGPPQVGGLDLEQEARESGIQLER
jgi:hypothetical protein